MTEIIIHGERFKMLPAFIAPLITSVVGGIVELIPNSNERAKAKENMEMQLLTIITAAVSGQQEINKQEAAHKSIFVAGWRPFIGWVCGFGIAWQFLFNPIANWVLLLIMAYNPDIIIPPLPILDIGELISLVMAMLGMGGLRTFEKLRGVSREQ